MPDTTSDPKTKEQYINKYKFLKPLSKQTSRNVIDDIQKQVIKDLHQYITLKINYTAYDILSSNSQSSSQIKEKNITYKRLLSLKDLIGRQYKLPLAHKTNYKTLSPYKGKKRDYHSKKNKANDSINELIKDNKIVKKLNNKFTSENGIISSADIKDCIDSLKLILHNYLVIKFNTIQNKSEKNTLKDLINYIGYQKNTPSTIIPLSKTKLGKQLSNVDHLRYWTGEGGNKRLRDQYGLITPKELTRDRRQVNQEFLSHLSYHPYRLGHTTIQTDQQQSTSMRINNMHSNNAGDLITGIKPDIQNIHTIFDQTKIPIVKLLGFLHELALEVNPGMASDIARIAFLNEKAPRSKKRGGASYTDWDAAQAMQKREPTELLPPDKNENNKTVKFKTLFNRNHNDRTANNDVMFCNKKAKNLDGLQHVTKNVALRTIASFIISKNDTKEAANHIRNNIESVLSNNWQDHSLSTKVIEYMRKTIYARHKLYTDNLPKKNILQKVWERLSCRCNSGYNDANYPTRSKAEQAGYNLKKQHKEGIMSYVVNTTGPFAIRDILTQTNRTSKYCGFNYVIPSKRLHGPKPKANAYTVEWTK